MSRWREVEDREQEDAGVGAGLSRSGGDARPRTLEEQTVETGFGSNRRELIVLRERNFHIRPSEHATLAALGRFRVINAEDLVQKLYGGDRVLARADLDAMRRQGLVASASVRYSSGEHHKILTLTRDGYQIVRPQCKAKQTLYWGFARHAEAAHDSRFYRAFRHEERKLASEGGRVLRVVLDYELKRGYFAQLNAAGDSTPYRDRQAEAARDMHLKVIDGHAVFPDFRIEYEDARNDVERVDVEIASDNYRDHHFATKAAAGFRVYAGAKAAGGFGVRQTPLGKGSFAAERSAVLLL